MIYHIRMPIAGYAEGEIDADSEEEALEQFRESIEIDDITEWEPHDVVGWLAVSIYAIEEES